MTPFAATQSPRNRGFTLVELMITVSIIGILGLISVPGVLRYVPTHRVNNAAKVLATELNLARMRAIARNHVHHVEFDLGNQIVRVWDDDDNDWATANTLVKTVNLATQAPNVSIDYNGVTGVDNNPISQAARFGTTSAPVRAVFLPNGLLADPGVLYLIPGTDKGTAVNDRMRAIEVTRSGQVTMHRYDAAPTPPWREY